ncbi:MAG: hypothetical protein LBD15_00790, partial [Holosporales bacterium]|nr:hypothetical protein [Holosporales bacterium]
SLFGLCAAIYIVCDAIKVMRRSVEELLDKGLTPEETLRLCQMIETQVGISKVAWIKTRMAGSSVFLIAGVCVRASTVTEMLNDLKRAQDSLRKDFSDAEIIFSVESRN